MELVDLIAGSTQQVTTLRAAKVISVEAGSLTVRLEGVQVPGVRYVGGKPAAGQTVLLATFMDQPVCLGAFGVS